MGHLKVNIKSCIVSNTVELDKIRHLLAVDKGCFFFRSSDRDIFEPFFLKNETGVNANGER